LGSNGNIGIGTETPLEKLTISGNILGTGNLTIQGLTSLATTTISTQLTVPKITSLADLTIDPTGNLVISKPTTISANFTVLGTSTLATTTLSRLTITELTPGSVLFAGAGGLISQDNSNLFWDNTNKRLGIGTSTPSQKLDVQGGNINTSGSLMTGGVARIDSSGNLINIGNITLSGTISGTYTIGGTPTLASSLTGSGSPNITGIGLLSATNLTISGTATTTNLNVTGLTNLATTTISTQLSVPLITSPSTLTISPSSNATTTITGPVILASQTGNVGIGTTAPATKLHILDNSVAPELRISSTLGVKLTLEADTDNVNESDQPVIELSQDGGIVKGMIGFFNSENAFSIYNTYGDALKLGTNNNPNMVYISSSGNVGIGTTAPATKLHILDNSVAPELRISSTLGVKLTLEADTDNVNESDQPVIELSQDGGIVKGMIGFFNSENAFSIYNTYGDALKLGTNNNPNMVYISSSGNVGIGTTAPGSRLTVSGGASSFGYLATPSEVSATATSGGTLSAGTYYYVVTALDSNNLSSAKSTEVSCTVDGSTTNACQISWSSVSGAAKYRVWRGTSSGGENQYFETTATSYTDTGTTGTSGTPPSSPISAYFAGNVGIGTTAPSEKLHVVGDTKIGNIVIRGGGDKVARIDNTVTGGELRAYVNWDGSQIDATLPSWAWTLRSRSGTDDFVIWRLPPGGTSWSALFVVNGAGNVGIGTTSPGSRLEVRGSTSDSSASALNITNSGGTSLLYVRNDGNVGIGTTAPSEKLHVVGDTKIGNIVIRGGGDKVARIDNTVTGGELRAYVNWDGSQIDATLPSWAWTLRSRSGTDDFVIWRLPPGGTSWSALFVVNGAGNVGIGTTSPGSRLEVRGSTSDSSASALNITNSGGTSLLYVRNDGNVGIGTTAPGSRLTVSGGASSFGYLATPSGVTAATTTGGNFSATGTYYYVVTALDSNNLSSANSSEVSCLIDPTSTACQISWSSVSGAAKYRVWRGTSSGGENQYFETTATSYTDTGTTGTSGTPPSSPTSAYFAGNVGIGTTAPSVRLSLGTPVQARMLALHDNPTDWYGFGIQPYQMRLQVGNTGARFSFFAGDTAEVMTILGNGNVGIGTTAPDNKLTLYGTASSLAGPHIKAITTADSYPVFQQLNWDHDNISLNFDSYHDGSWRSASSGSNYQIYKYGNLLRFRYASGVAAGSTITWNEGIVLNTSGNVGIGTTSPGSRLEVRGSTSDSSASALNITNSGGTSLLYVRNDGNVGIGTTAPGSRLTVSGGASSFGYLATPSGVTAATTTGGNFSATGTYYYVVTALDSNNLSSANSSEVSCLIDPTSTACQISWSSVSGAAKYRVWRGTSSGGENQYFETTATSYTDTGTTGTSGTPPSSPTSAYFAGNVGIGTTAPSVRLSLGTPVQARMLALHDNPTDWYGFGIQPYQMRLQVGNTGARFSFFAGDTAEVMTILGNGNVGIGTTAPLEKLDVAGAIKVGNTSSACDDAHRGVIKFIPGGSGVADHLAVCEKDAAGNYAWVYIGSSVGGFKYRKPITINNTQNTNTLTDYQVLVTLDTASLISAGKMRSDCGDIRFTDSDGVTNLNYWLESGCNTTSTKIWVKVPLIPANSTKTIYVYYGNPSATSLSSVVNTFIREIDGAQPLKGSWHFDEGSGTTAYDDSGNGNNGTIYGATWVSGKFGQALSFDGVDDYVEIPNSASLNPTNEITVEAWFYPVSYTSGTGWHGIVGKAPYTNGYLLWVEETGSVSGLIYVGGIRYNVYSGYNAPLNQWTHAVYTVKQGRMDIYINGQWRAKTDIPTGAFNTNTNPLRIAGQGEDSTQPWFRGLIDDVRIYNRALTDAEISDLYNNYGYTTTNYPGRVLVRKYTSPEPTTSVGTEEAADIAEWFKIDPNCSIQNNCPEGGDLVAVNENGFIEKSSKPYQQTLIGVISSNPKEILGEGNENDSRPVALIGTVPVKVATKNGEIKPGDYLTSSDIPGVAMKANGFGRVIGMALEPYSGEGIGKIKVFLNPHFAMIPLFEDGTLETSTSTTSSTSTATSSETSILDSFTLAIKNALKTLGLIIENGIAKVKEIVAEKLTAEIVVTKEIKTERITTNEIQIVDKATGEIYCTWIENGEWVKVKGECESLTSQPVTNNEQPASNETTKSVATSSEQQTANNEIASNEQLSNEQSSTTASSTASSQ